MTEENPIPPNLQAALVLLLTLGLTSLATKMGFDAKDTATAIATVAVSLAGLLGAGYVWLITHMQVKKADTAEARSPRITDAKLLKPTEELTVTMTKNDVTDSMPAQTVTTYTPPVQPNQPEI